MSDLSSWQRLCPDEWTNDNVLDLIYYLASQQERVIKAGSLRGEQFQGMSGVDICAMTKAEFLERDPIYGSVIYDFIAQLKRTNTGTNCKVSKVVLNIFLILT